MRLILLAVLLLTACEHSVRTGQASSKYEPSLVLHGESYAIPEAANLRTFSVIVFDEAGHVTHDLAYQIYDDAIRSVLVEKGYRAVEIDPDLLISISAVSDSTAVASERTEPTATFIPGGTSQIRTTNYTSLGPINGTSTVTTNPQFAYGEKTVTDTTIFQRGRIEIVALDQRFYVEHPSLGEDSKRVRQAWLMRFAYSYDLPISLPRQNFIPRILKLTAANLGVQSGEWIRSTTLGELLKL